MEMKNNKLIVVLGMHRSGTSAITRGLQVVGVRLGDRMMPPVEGDNAKGYWEDIDLNALNIEMLRTIDSDWYHLSAIDAIDVEILRKQGYFLRAIELLRQKVASATVFGFKDPRVAKLLPFWKEVFSHCQFDVSYLLAVRHPLSVVKSLAKRSGFETEQSYLLWLGHVITSLTGSAGDKRVLVDYDRLMQLPDRELMRIAKCTGLEIDSTELQSYKSEFLDQGLRHTVYELNDLLLDDTCPPIVREIYAALLDVASEKIKFEDLELQNEVVRWSDEFKRLRSPLLLIDRISTQKAECEGQIVNLTQTVTERDGQIASLNQAVVARDVQIADLTQEVVRRGEWGLRLDVQIADLTQTVSARDVQIVNLEDEVVRRGEWALRLDAELKEERARLLGIRHCNSWRLTLPLREVRRWISTPKQQTKKYVKGYLCLVERIYQSLPLSCQTKSAHFAKSIKIPSSHNPLISVIIPIYGKVDYTLRCLASIAENPPRAAFEVIIVDDCSPDNSAKVLTKVKGLRLIRNAQNQGFIRSCNAGASAAQGEYLYFLNNDTEVTPGWIDELLRTFQEFPGTGLAGSKLIYPDGRLQEAGGIIWQDGSAWNFGHNQDPSLPVYNYAREVDYCSGASIMVPKALFEELGGFDEHYLPAYCEDSDLALKIRDKGYRVIYQPMSAVIHYEGVTSGTDTSQGIKAYQVENMKKVCERWKSRLQTHQPHGTDVDNAKDRRATRRVLVIDHCTPTPNQDAGSVTVFNLLLLLREMDFQVTFIPEDNFFYMSEYTTALQRRGIEVLYGPYVTNVQQHLNDCGDRYDLVFLFRPTVVEHHLETIRKFCPKAKVLFHTVDLHFLRMSREAELQSDKEKQQAADEMKQRELAAIRAVDASIVHSTTELEILYPELPGARIHVFPLIMDIKGTSKTFAERKDIVFVGGYQHTPNVDAVQYFVAEIMPLLRKHLPGVRFHAVGSKPPAEIQALAAEDVVITGFVENLTPLLDTMRISVAPLRYGAGIKGKIGTAMAVGLPVVATSLAAEGMSLSEGENILVADGAENFANTVAKIYRDELSWNRISKNGLDFADKAWGAEAAWGILAAILGDLGINEKRGAHPLSLYSELKIMPKSNTQKTKEDIQ